MEFDNGSLKSFASFQLCTALYISREREREREMKHLRALQR